jgi:glutamate dehydrogenase/leucine dehydrogenase
VKQYYELWGGTVAGKRAVVQGWGNVGAAAGFYLAQMGVHIVGIMGREGGLINQKGYTLEEVKRLVIDRQGNRLVSADMLPYETVNQKIWDLEFDIFVPAAASRLVNKEQVDKMAQAGVEVFSCGANVPFADPEIFFGATGLYADEKFSVIPDFIANCGMARVFAYFMENEVSMTDEDIFNDIAHTIRKALEQTKRANPGKTKLAQASFEIALRQLVK